MITVLNIITTLDISKSTPNIIETVARLNEHEYQSTIVIGKTLDPQGKIHAQLTKYKINYIFINELRDGINLWLDFISFVKIFKIIRSGNYDIVHTHLYKAGIIGRCAARLLSVKHIVHTPYIKIFCHHFSKLLTSLSFLTEKIFASFTEVIIASNIKEKLNHIGLGIGRPSKLVQIYNGVDFSNINIIKDNSANIKRKLNIDDDFIVFGNISKLDPLNQNDILIKAMLNVVKIIPNSLLVIAEEGSRKEELIELSKTLNIAENIKFLGSGYDKYDFIDILDIFVLCSLNKSIERTVLKAMYCEKPVIASNISSLHEIIVESKTGILVDSDDSKSFAEAMISLANSKEHLLDYGASGKKLAIDVFSIDTMVSKTEDLYNNLIMKNI